MGGGAGPWEGGGSHEEGRAGLVSTRRGTKHMAGVRGAGVSEARGHLGLPLGDRAQHSA